MKIDRRDKAKGKTTDLIMRSEKTGYTILCADHLRKTHIEKVAKDLNVTIPTPMTVLDSKRPDFRLLLQSDKILIDDVETVLVKTIGVPVDVVTTSSELISHNKQSYIMNAAHSIAELVDRKNHDYDNSFDKSIDKRGNDVYFIRIEDKLSRLENLLKSNEKAKINESIEDTLKDIVGYTLLMMNYLNNKQV